MNELKNMGKTNTLKITEDKSVNKIDQNNIIKTSVKDRNIRQTILKIENVNQTYTYSKTDDIKQCKRISGYYTIISNIQGKNLKFVSQIEILNNHF